MKPEYIAYGIYIYMFIGFLLWLWAMVDDVVTRNRHRGGLMVALEALIAMVLGWPFIVPTLLKPRGRK